VNPALILGEYTISGATVNPALISLPGGRTDPENIAVSDGKLFVVNSNCTPKTKVLPLDHFGSGN
jgi:hypothetical protein